MYISLTLPIIDQNKYLDYKNTGANTSDIFVFGSNKNKKIYKKLIQDDKDDKDDKGDKNIINNRKLQSFKFNVVLPRDLLTNSIQMLLIFVSQMKPKQYFEIYKYITYNKFFNYLQHDAFMKAFENNMRIKMNIMKFIFKIRGRIKNKIIPKNEYNLMANNINEIPSKYTILIMDNLSTVWCFDIRNLVKSIGYNLTTSSYMVSEPSQPKNPYNNIYFTPNQLIYIYNFACSRIQIPTSFRMYKSVGFSIVKMTLLYRRFLIKKAIVDSCCNMEKWEIIHFIKNIIKVNEISEICGYKMPYIQNKRMLYRIWIPCEECLETTMLNRWFEDEDFFRTVVKQNIEYDNLGHSETHDIVNYFYKGHEYYMVNQLEHEYKHKKFIRAKRNIQTSNRSIGTGTSSIEIVPQIYPQSTNQETNTNTQEQNISNEVVRDIMNEITNNIISSSTFIV